jgi:hypothetical protein
LPIIRAIVSRTGVQPGDNTPVYWLWGESSTEGRGIRIGFDNSAHKRQAFNGRVFFQEKYK